MNTPAHIIFAAAAFARPGAARVNGAAVVGGFAPDLSLYLLGAWSLLVQGRTPRQVFDDDYFSAARQTVFAVDNSVFVWGAVLGLGLWSGRRWLAVAAGAALLHIAFDLPLHHDDGRAHFWPATDWVFQSPISYWDPGHHGRVVGLLEAGAVAFLAVVLWRRFRDWAARSAVVLCAAANLAPFLIWRLAFG